MCISINVHHWWTFFLCYFLCHEANFNQFFAKTLQQLLINDVKMYVNDKKKASKH